MSDKAITRRLKIYINGKEVDATISNLTKNLSKFRAASNRAVEGTPEWKKYNAEVAKLETELNQARAAQKKFRTETGLTTKAVTNAKKGMSNIFPSVSGAILFTDVLKGALNYTKEFLVDAVQMAEESRGIEFAFKKLGDEGEDAFSRVKTATRGLLSDLEIKRSLVEFDNFNISLDESATLFEFLTVRATQTGESVDKLKSSLVEGLSKESKLRIDNLGISTAVLNAELEKTPNFVQAVANIAKVEIAKAGTILDDAASSNQRWNATLQNSQLRIGQLINSSGIVPFFQKLGTAVLETVVPMEKASEASEKERISLFVLEAKIKDVNTTNEDRVKLINQLKEKYPGLLANVDAERISNTDLSKAIKLVNDELVNKIILEEKDEEVLKQVNKIASAKLGFLEAETRAREYLAAAAAKEGIQIKEGVSLTEQLRDAYEQVNKGKSIVEKNTTLKVALEQLQFTQKNLNAVTEEGNLLEEKRNALAAQLNISQDVLNSGNNTPEEVIDLTKKVQLLSDINEEIAKQKELLNATSNNSEYKKIQEEIKILEAKKRAITGEVEKIKEPTQTDEEKELLAEDKRKIESKKKVAEWLKQWNADQKIQKEIEDLEENEAAQLKEELELENRYLKLEENAEGEKQLLKDLEIAKNTELAAIKKKWEDKFWKDNNDNKKKIAEDDKKFKEESIKAEQTLQDAKASAILGGLGFLKSMAKEGTEEYKALFAIEKLAAVAQVVLAGQRERAAYAANPTWSAMPDGGAVIKGKYILASKIRTGVSLATIAASTIKGFDEGGYTFDGAYSGGVDGKGGKLSILHPEEYVIPKPVRDMPEVPRIIEYLEAKRTGKPITSLDEGGEAGETTIVENNNNFTATTDPELNAILVRLNTTLLNLKINYTLEDEKERQRLQQKLDDTINASKN